MALTVNAIVIRSGQVLLMKREDFQVWGVPGGHVDPEESVAEAAVREAKEETGYDVALGALIGVYSAIGDWQDMHACAFMATVGPEEPGPLGTPEEVADLGWFDIDRLPGDTIWWHAARIADAVAGRSGLVVAQRIRSPLGRLDREALYAARDASGMSRLDFFRHNFPAPH